VAIIPETQYAGKITPASAEYPYGQARNITLPGDGSGTPWEAALVNDIFGFQQALLDEAGITPSGDPETATESQYLESLRKLFSERRTAGFTVNVPADYGDWQAAIDDLFAVQVKPSEKIVINLETGHEIDVPLVLKNGDYSKFEIVSEDATVPVATGFSDDIISGEYAILPQLSCVIDATNQTAGNGARVSWSGWHVSAGNGIINAWGTGQLTRYASRVSCNDTVWTGSARNAVTGAAITCWGSIVDAQGCDASDSGYYGLQAAHGGILNAREATANDCSRYGVRATDGALCNFDAGSATNAGEINIYAFNLGIVNARDAIATGGGRNIVAARAGTINANGATASGAVTDSVQCFSASSIDVSGADLTNCGQYGIHATSGTVDASGADTTGCDRGVFAERAGVVDFGSGTASNCSFGIYAQNGSTVNANEVIATGCTNTGIFASAATVHAEDGDVSGATTFGVRYVSQANGNIRNANCQRGGASDPDDIVVGRGSILAAHGASGGISQTANSITSDGIIFQ
jgi:hypothetical protein